MELVSDATTAATLGFSLTSQSSHFTCQLAQVPPDLPRKSTGNTEAKYHVLFFVNVIPDIPLRYYYYVQFLFKQLIWQ